ncbi:MULTISPECIES: recombinase family protein [Bacillus]|uniref:recombinase family protein n=1 Tax=Bacillus TaxID=1386 RepID=UPI00030585D3|nr:MULTISPECIES: recombinase family protein [Bacillus]
MIHNQNRVFKKACFYQRVSTKSQDVEMQVQAAARFRGQYAEDEIITINEHGVSSNKLSMKERKHLLEFIERVKRDEIHTLYVYDRSRLTRRFYEYFCLYSLLWEHNVEVIFTTTDPSYPPFSRNTVTEAINALLTEEEGKHISRRLHDLYRKTPVTKFGYQSKLSNETKQYIKHPDVEDEITIFLNALTYIDCLEDLLVAATKLKKTSKRTLKMILSMCIDPFYCGCEKTNDKLFPLTHVEPYITVEQFRQNEAKFEPLLRDLALQQTELELQDLFSVICGHCGKRLKYEITATASEAYYYCNCAKNKKERIRYRVEEIKTVAITAVKNSLQNLNTDYIQSVTIQQLQKVITQLSTEKMERIRELQQEEHRFSLQNLRAENIEVLQRGIQRIQDIKSACLEIESDINVCQLTLQCLKENVSIVQNQLVEQQSEVELIRLIPTIIADIIAYHDKIEVVQFFYDKNQSQETYQVIEVNE